MFRKLHTHVNAGTLLAVVALFVALGGISYAATKIQTRDLANGAVTSLKTKNDNLRSKDIRNDNLRSKDIRDGNLRGEDVRADTLTGDHVDESTLGQVPSAASADSAQTADAVGPDGVDSAALQANSVRASELGAVVLRTATSTVAAGGTTFDTRSCATGERLISGGVRWLGSGIAGDAADLRIVHSYPTGTTTWGARMYNGTASPRDMRVHVLCLAV